MAFLAALARRLCKTKTSQCNTYTTRLGKLSRTVQYILSCLQKNTLIILVSALVTEHLIKLWSLTWLLTTCTILNIYMSVVSIKVLSKPGHVEKNHIYSYTCMLF